MAAGQGKPKYISRGVLVSLLLNIFVPLFPIVFKLALNVGTKSRLAVTTDDELLYYGLVLCVIHIDMFKTRFSWIEALFVVGAVILAALNGVYIIAILLNCANDFVHNYVIAQALICRFRIRYMRYREKNLRRNAINERHQCSLSVRAALLCCCSRIANFDPIWAKSTLWFQQRTISLFEYSCRL